MQISSCLKFKTLSALGILIAASTVAQAQTPITLPATADAFVRDGSYASANYGSDASLLVKKNSTGVNRWTYLKFDLSSVNVNAIGTVKLRLYGRVGTSAGQSADAATSVFSTPTTSWVETGITWNNKPLPVTKAIPIVQRTMTHVPMWYEVDLTSFVQAEKNANRNLISLVLQHQSASTPATSFNARENITNQPQLVIEAPVAPPTGPTPTTLAATADAMVRDGSYANTNYGTGTGLDLKKNNPGFNRWDYLKFDLSAAGTIVNAKLRLFGRVSDTATSSISAGVYSVADSAWVETGTGGLTWNNKPALGATALATRTITSAAATWYEWDVTNFLRDEKAAGRNVVSLAVQSNSLVNPMAYFNARENGSNQPQLALTLAENVGQWAPPVNWGIVVSHAHVLPNGKVLLWDGTVPSGGTQIYLWDPETQTRTPVTQTLKASGSILNVYCTGHSFLPDGKLLITGGHRGQYLGEKETLLYDYATNTFTLGPDMNLPRWYPSNVTLPSGDALVASGTIDGPVNFNTLMQVYQTATGTYRDLPFSMPEEYMYPMLHVAPNGQVFSAGPGRDSYYIDPSGVTAPTLVAANNYGYRGDYSASVMYEPGKVLVLGGNPPTEKVEAIDLNDATPAWRYASPMKHARRHPNTVLMPDGKVFISGGMKTSSSLDSDAVLPTEIWDPQTEEWNTLASLTIPRVYHSVAVLLPDGRVFTGGGGRGRDFIDHLDYQIFSPPYLFKGPRPTVTSAPATVNYGVPFVLETPDAANIAKVTWVRLPSITHSTNQNQRFNSLTFAPTTDGLLVTPPASANLCPPGHYMLFVFNTDGTPSVAKIVQIL